MLIDQSECFVFISHQTYLSPLPSKPMHFEIQTENDCLTHRIHLYHQALYHENPIKSSSFFFQTLYPEMKTLTKMNIMYI